ncbi:hypothetical protein L596_000778 [Steinernema carpocapsae]|uniref:Uncharacterized protein n=1 Tax=Steinernema carpocapsae TaxID=34508 RepID=A0A4U8UJG0_STECR|nr:hypothetical protein L596_000778 [Steinernema carpocapsae]
MASKRILTLELKMLYVVIKLATTRRLKSKQKTVVAREWDSTAGKNDIHEFTLNRFDKEISHKNRTNVITLNLNKTKNA